MKILHLVGARADHGGILSVLRAFQGSAESLGLRHQVWVNSDFQQVRQPELTLRYCRHALDESDSHPQLLWHAIRSLPSLLRLLRQECPSIIHAHSRGSFLLAIALARLQALPVVFTQHTYPRRLGMYRRAANSGKLTVVLLTPAMARYHGIDPGDGVGDGAAPLKVRIISACAMDQHFAVPLAKRRDVPDNVRLVGIGNIVGWKKWHLLAEAVGLMDVDLRNRLQIEIWGPTPSDAKSVAYDRGLRQQIGAANLKGVIRLMGATSSVGDVVASADWFVLPSTDEPCSVALMEALARGVPALVSRSGGNVDIVREGLSGAFFEPDDAMSLARRIELIVRRNVIVAPSDQIRESVRCRSATVVSGEYARLYEELRSAVVSPS